MSGYQLYIVKFMSRTDGKLVGYLNSSEGLSSRRARAIHFYFEDAAKEAAENADIDLPFEIEAAD